MTVLLCCWLHVLLCGSFFSVTGNKVTALKALFVKALMAENAKIKVIDFRLVTVSVLFTVLATGCHNFSMYGPSQFLSWVAPVQHFC